PAVLVAGRQPDCRLRRPRARRRLAGAGRTDRDRADRHLGAAARAGVAQRSSHAGAPADGGLSGLSGARLPAGGARGDAVVRRERAADCGGEGRAFGAGYEKPIQRPPHPTVDHSRIEMTPTALPTAGLKRASSAEVTRRRTVNVKMIASASALILIQNAKL